MRETAERYSRLQLELQEERAAALGRISRTLEVLIDQLRALHPHVAHRPWFDDSPELAHYRELRRRAVRFRWYLEVQREALGLHPDHRLDEFYRIPEPV
jgi:hypothetical protein